MKTQPLTTIGSRLAVWFVVLLLTACVQARPSPDRQAVLAILRQYPSSTLIDDRLLKNQGDVEHLISFDVQTTPKAAIAYYDQLLQEFGMKGYAPSGAFRNNLQVDYRWIYDGCPYHTVEMGVTAKKLQITYATGPCR